MPRIRIEDLPVMEDISPEECQGLFGGISVMFNPKEYSLTKSTTWDGEGDDLTGTTSQTKDDDEPGLAGVTIYIDSNFNG